MRQQHVEVGADEDRKSTRLNSSHQIISYAVFCLKKKERYHVPRGQSVGRTALQPRGDTVPRDATRQPYDLPVETGGGLALDLFVAFARNAYAIQGHRMASDRRRRFRQGNGRTR